MSDRSSPVDQLTSREIEAPAAAPLDALYPLLAEQVPVLRQAARGICRDPAEAEDLVQDTFEKALRSLHTLDRKQSPRGWMVTILYNLHIDRCRHHARQQPHVPFEDVELVAPEPGSTPAWTALGTDDVRRAVTQLPEELRATYTMFALEGRPYADISAVLGIPKTTVGTRVLRARRYLKELLTQGLGEDA